LAILMSDNYGQQTLCHLEEEMFFGLIGEGHG